MTAPEPRVTVATITIKAQNVPRVARFWRDLLGYVVVPNHSDSAHLADPAGHGPAILVQPSSHPAATAGAQPPADPAHDVGGFHADRSHADRSHADRSHADRIHAAPIHTARIHLDLRPDDQHRAVARAVTLGATLADLGQVGDEGWVVLADPEGNHFCVLESAAAHAARLARDPGRPTPIDEG